MSAAGSFLAEIKEIRRRARQHREAGAVTRNYGGQNVIAERIAIETYGDSTTRVLLERILAQEEEHPNDDMHDLLVSHDGRPTLER
jgi:hypothetical protein